MNRHSPPTRPKAKAAKGPAAEAPNGSPNGPPNSGKRERILDAAVRVFAQEGFYNAKVAQIAHVAGVADGTIYLYFKSKDDLLISLFEDRMERINANLRAALIEETTAVARLTRVVKMHLELVEQNRPMAEVICVELRQSSKFIKEYKNPKFADFLRLIASAVEGGQASGELRSDVDAALIARALFGALDEIALAWLVRGKEKLDLSRAAAQLSNLFIEGLKQRSRT